MSESYRSELIKVPIRRAGVRVLTPRIPAAAVHVLPDMSSHRLGGCAACEQLTPPGAPLTTQWDDIAPGTLPGPARQVRA